VLSIVVVQPFIYKQLYFKNWLSNQIWLLLSVTFAAQIGTLPFTLHYFHQFPVYFWLANLAVIPLVTLILYLSFVLLFLFFVSGFLTSACALVLDWSVRLILLSVNLVETLPHAVIRGLYPSLFQVSLVFLMGYLFYRFVKIRKTVLLAGALCSAIVLTISLVICSFRQLTRAEVIFFNLPGTRAMALTSGRKATVLYDRGEKNAGKLDYYLKPYLGERGIKQLEMYSLSDSLRVNGHNISVTGDFIFFKDVRLWVQPLAKTDPKSINNSLCADLVWLSPNKTGQNHLDFPGSKVILYRSSGNSEKERIENPATKWLNMKKSVQLTILPSLPGSSNRFTCGYFNEADQE
jgi:competence protein ComEC